MCVCLVFLNIIMFTMFKRAIVFYCKHSTNTQPRYNVAKYLSYLHHNNIILMCKSHYINCLIKIMGIVNLLGNSSYTLTTMDTLWVVRVRCEFWKILEICWSTYNQGPYYHVLKHLTSLSSTQLFHTQR